MQLRTTCLRSLGNNLSLSVFTAFCGMSVFFLAGAAAPLGASADGKSVPPTLPFLDTLFSDNMVLQRSQSDPVWGWTTPGTSVLVVVAGKSTAAIADTQGKWMAKLPALPVGGPYTLTVSSQGNQTVTRSNVMVGDVWLCSGQSNMELSVGEAADAQSAFSTANYPSIRLMIVPHSLSVSPQATTDTTWRVCTPEALGASGFSAVGYFFGRSLYTNVHVPIGLIESAFGGTNAEAWTNEEALQAKLPAFRPQLARLDAERAVGQAGWQERYTAQEAEWYTQNDPGSAPGISWADPDLDTLAWPKMSLPGDWEDQHIPTLASFDGVVWFRKDITLTADQASKASTLSFKADDNDTTWINGIRIGATQGAFDQRGYRVPAGALKTGRNVVAIRVLDTGGNGGIWGDAGSLHLAFDGAADMPLAGDWHYKIGVSLTDARSLVPSPIEADQNFSSVLYNGMISPLIPYGIKGAIWYQGENNTIRPTQYRTLLPALIGGWRSRWGEGSLPFLIVQIAGYQNSPDPANLSWPELRDAQWKTAQTVPNVGIATAVDIGDAANIHPKNKQEVGRRLALVARAQVYHESVEASGPVYQSMTVAGSHIRLTFTHTGGLLSTKNGMKLTGFLICGSDHQWTDADAEILGSSVVVSSVKVSHPVAVRYSWSAAPDANLINKAGLPAFPFQTYDFPPSTVDAKVDQP
ncbi:MAG: sialate O-acetylesterase [Janthinobacterium lividum]